MNDALAAIYRSIGELVASLADRHFVAATGCADFCVRDLLFHQLLDAQRALVTLADPVDPSAAVPDTDATTYWQKYVAASDPDAEMVHGEYVRRGALAYSVHNDLVRHWLATSTAAVAAARRADPGMTVATQGHRLRIDDFIDTLVVEATIHYWDLTLELVEELDIPASAMAVTRSRLEELAGAELPTTWDDRAVLVKTTGRAPLTAEDRLRLGDAVDRIPVLR